MAFLDSLDTLHSWKEMEPWLNVTEETMDFDAQSCSCGLQGDLCDECWDEYYRQMPRILARNICLQVQDVCVKFQEITFQNDVPLVAQNLGEVPNIANWGFNVDFNSIMANDVPLKCPRDPRKKVARKLMWDEDEIKVSRWGFCEKCRFFSKDECIKKHKMCKYCFKKEPVALDK